MRMIRGCAWWLWILVAEFPGRGTVDEGSVYLYAFDALLGIGWCHDVVVCVALLLSGDGFSGVFVAAVLGSHHA